MGSQCSLCWIFVSAAVLAHKHWKKVASFWVWYARVNLIEVYYMKKFIGISFSGYTKSIVKHTHKTFKV